MKQGIHGGFIFGTIGIATAYSVLPSSAGGLMDFQLNQHYGKLFKGYRLIACDGSDINIAHNTTDSETYFKSGKSKGFNQLHLNAVYDLLNKTYTDIVIISAIKNQCF